jgi:hypothetical protein
VFFGAPTIAASLVIAALNRSLWGSMLMSGYGSLSTLFSVAQIVPSTLIYLRAFAVQIPVLLLLPVAAYVGRSQQQSATGDRTTTVGLWSFALAAVLLYLAWPPFDSAWNLRFLLPAIPPLIVLTSIAALSLARRALETHRLACLVAIIVLAGYGVDHARRLRAFDNSPLQRYADIGPVITNRLPERAVLFAMLHSGSANYYTGRPTLRYDLLPPSRLDSLVRELGQRGYVPYLLLDSDERADFQKLYSGHSRLAALDWSPVVTLKPFEVQIYAIPPQP